MRKFICNTLIILLLTGVYCDAYFTVSQLSSGRIWLADSEVYANDTWQDVTQDDLVTAFRYYCKSRNLTIDGSIADALTSFTTTTFNNICNTLGIDVNALQADLKKTVEGNLGLRFLMNQQGVLAYNRIFAEFLQNNDLSVGDEVENKQIYSGEYLDGAFLWHLYNKTNYVNQNSWNTIVLQQGSYYKYQSLIGFSSGNVLSFPFFDYSATIGYKENYSVGNVSQCTGNFVVDYFNNNNPMLISGSYKLNGSLINVTSSQSVLARYNNSYAIYAFVYENPALNGRGKFIFRISPWFTSDDSPEDATVNLTTNNTTINNNDYSKNFTIIYNDGDYYEDDDEPSPTTPPGGGGGGGGDDPLDPYDPNKPFPDTPDNPTPTPGITDQPGSDGTITIPDFNFDLPDINWSLDGLQHKFPFSLPFDLYNACKLMDAEPQTPELDYTIDLVVYQWPVKYDLHWLDPAARVIRIFELLAFVVGLILITRKMLGD